jgi:hypothetical protein
MSPGQEASLDSAPPLATLASLAGVTGREGVQKPDVSEPKVYSDPVPGKPFDSHLVFEWPRPGRVPLEGQLGRGPTTWGTSTTRGCRRRCLGSGLRAGLGVLLGVL